MDQFNQNLITYLSRQRQSLPAAEGTEQNITARAIKLKRDEKKKIIMPNQKRRNFCRKTSK
jgi:hypothetical protein